MIVSHPFVGSQLELLQSGIQLKFLLNFKSIPVLAFHLCVFVRFVYLRHALVNFRLFSPRI